MKHPLALVYSGEGRDNGTPFYYRLAMTRMGIPHNWYWPQNPAGIPRDHAFYFVIDDGRDDLAYLPPHPCGYYATDTHLGWEHRRKKAAHFDIVWCAQKPAADRMRSEGLNAHWVPLACCPEMHPCFQFQSAVQAPRYDLGFVGHLMPDHQSNRVEFLDQLFRAFPNSRMEFGVFHRDMARVYHQCRIAVNHAVRDDLNMRFFEIASLGVVQLCDSRMVGLAELGFNNCEHYWGYTNAAEAQEAARWILSDRCGQAHIAEAALKLVRDQHTYEHRVGRLMHDIHRFTGENYALLAAFPYSAAGLTDGSVQNQAV